MPIPQRRATLHAGKLRGAHAVHHVDAVARRDVELERVALLAHDAARGEVGDRTLGRGVTACVLFVPAKPGKWLDRVAGCLGGRRGPFRVVIGIDELLAGSSGQLRRWLYRAVAPGAPTRAELRQIHDRLAKAGAVVQVIQRTTGQSVPESEY